MNDGSIDSAAQAIAAARESSPVTEAPVSEQASAEVIDIKDRQAPDRAADGKFQKAEPAETPTDPAGEADDDDEYIELEIPDEDGKEPKRERLKLAEVYDGYRRASELEKELQAAKTAQPLPEHFERETEATIKERLQYQQTLEEWRAYNRPQPPSRDLINPASPNYDPERYYQLMQVHDEMVTNHQRVAQEIERVQKQNAEQQAQLHRSRLLREREALLKVWPEMNSRTALEKVAKDLERHFGIDQETLKSVSDHRFYALAKDALAYREAQAAKKEAVKAVVAKPKLVRANARSNIDSKAAARDAGFGKLAKTGSLEDAASLIANLR